MTIDIFYFPCVVHCVSSLALEARAGFPGKRATPGSMLRPVASPRRSGIGQTRAYLTGIGHYGVEPHQGIVRIDVAPTLRM